MTLTSEQRTKIQQTVLAGNNVPRVNNVNFALNVGVSVPRSVRVVDVPSTLIEIYPQWRGHQYFVVNDDIVIVDRSRRIVTTLPMSSSAGGAAQVDRRAGGAPTDSAGDLVNLGPDEIRQVQIVLKERGFYRGEPDGVLGPATTQALIVIGAAVSEWQLWLHKAMLARVLSPPIEIRLEVPLCIVEHQTSSARIVVVFRERCRELP